jgi:thiamine-phosphate pyrophosphorylase
MSTISLYILTDPKREAADTLFGLERALKGAPGRIAMIIRHNDPTLAMDAAALAVEHNAPCFMAALPNGRTKGDYVHVGALHDDDIVPGGAYTASAHNVAQAIRAKTAQALLVGPLFDDPKKPPARATALLIEVRKTLPKMPLYALGGVGLAQIDACVRAGADGIAVTRAVMNAQDPAKVARDLVQEIDRARIAVRNRSRVPSV